MSPDSKQVDLLRHKDFKKTQVTVILTCAGSPVIPKIVSLMKESKNYEVSVIGIDAKDKDQGVGGYFCDSFFKVPSGNDDNYFEVVKNLIIEHDVRLVFPSSDEEALALSGRREQILELGCDVACSSHKTTKLASRKVSLFEYLEKAGLSVCRYRAFDSLDQLRSTATEFGYPEKRLLVKPSFGRGSDGVFVLDANSTSKIFPDIDLRGNSASLEGFERLWGAESENRRDFILMEYMPGEKYSCDILVRNGEPQMIVTRNNGSTVKSRPPTVSARLGVVSDVENYAREVCARLVFDYFVQIEIGRRDDGGLGLIEVNARLDATLTSTRISGVNFFEEMLCYRSNGEFRNFDRLVAINLADIEYRRYWEEVFFRGRGGNFLSETTNEKYWKENLHNF
jgi:carbamoyl-phosphate synthase large subunit